MLGRAVAERTCWKAPICLPYQKKGRHYGLYSRRELEKELITVRVYNGGRPVDIESIYLQAAKTGESIVDENVSRDKHPLLLLESGRTYLFRFPASSLQRLIPLQEPDEKALSIKLADGESVMLEVSGLKQIFEDVECYVHDLQIGHEVYPHPAFCTWTTPVRTRPGQTAPVAQAREGRWLLFKNEFIPEKSEIRVSRQSHTNSKNIDDMYQKSDPVSAEEDAAWREGRCYRQELVEKAHIARRSTE